MLEIAVMTCAESQPTFLSVSRLSLVGRTYESLKLLSRFLFSIAESHGQGVNGLSISS